MASFTGKFKVGIVGATGAVGIEVVSCLYRRSFSVASLHMYASSRSAGKVVETDYGKLTIEDFSVAAARACDIVFLAVSGDFALENAEAICVNDGPIVIDNSSAFRYRSDVPLVVPEINPETLRNSRLIANPNCTTAIAAVVLWPLHKAFGIKKLIMSTYQAASGAGAEGMDELITGTKVKLEGGKVENIIFSHPLPFNLIPHIDKFLENSYTKEEMKVVWETHKIFGITDPDELRVSCTAVRIPIMRAHSEAITIETAKPISADGARALLINAPGVRVVDDIKENQYPMPLTASNSFDVEVGRVRESLVFAPYGLDLFVSGDQLLRGAALNAVLIAETAIEMGLMKNH